MSALFLMSKVFIIVDFVVLCLEDKWELSIFVVPKCNGWNDQFQVLLNSWISVNFPIKCYKSQDSDFNFISNKSKLNLPFTEYSIKIAFKPINFIQLEIKYWIKHITSNYHTSSYVINDTDIKYQESVALTSHKLNSSFLMCDQYDWLHFIPFKMSPSHVHGSYKNIKFIASNFLTSLMGLKFLKISIASMRAITTMVMMITGCYFWVKYV